MPGDNGLIWAFGAVSGGGEHPGRYGGELSGVDRAAGIDLDNRAEPKTAAGLTPQLFAFACGIKMPG